MMVCVIGGAGGVIGAEHLQQSREKELLLAKNSVQVETAKLLFDIEQERLDLAEVRWEQGLIGQKAVGEARMAADEATFELKRLELDGAEIEASGRAPDRRLTAPLVGNRDFVAEALRLERQRAGALHQNLAGESQRAEALAAAGRISSVEVSRARQRSLAHELELHAIDERLELRADFLLGRRDAWTTDLLEIRSRAQHALEQIEKTIDEIRAEYQMIQARVSAGVVSQTELTTAESTLRRAEGELELRRLELELVDERLGR
jgi:hypothetical protein